ncbi:MAG: nucleotide exchange factor GrpE [Ruminococcaceae bacterium]|nr:nucleotide exchange factor GrpE [Oscillospiraceae bacterium]
MEEITMTENESVTVENDVAENTEAPAEAEVEAAEEKLKGADKKKLKRAEAELADTKAALEKAQTALKEENEKYLRMLAEYDNFRRRTAKEKETIYADAVVDTVAELLAVVDNLERAAQSTDGTECADAVVKGVEMTLKSALDALSKLGVSVIETKTFNPDFHNAVMHVEEENLGEGEIVEVYQKGYIKGDKVIRYAMVKVAN